MLAVNPAVIGFPAIVRTARLLVTVAEDMTAGWHTAILTLASGMPCLLTTGELLDPRLPWAPNFAGRQSVMITLRRASAALILASWAFLRAGCAWSHWQPVQYLASLRSSPRLCISLHLHTRHLLGSGSGGNPD